MPESWRTRLTRLGWNLYPVYRGSGGRITYIADDWREVRVEVPLSWRTRNYVGTIYGGSMYGAVDPIYMITLIKALGPEYVVWDKAASIRFLKPGRDTLFARFVLTESELTSIRSALAERRSLDRVYQIPLTDAAGRVHAEVEKTLYIARKERALPSRPPSPRVAETLWSDAVDSTLADSFPASDPPGWTLG